MTLRVILADDHPLALAGLSDALAQAGGFEVMGRAPNGISAIALIKRHGPDCAVLDLSMPGATGLEVVLEARRWSPETRYVVVTGTGAGSLLRELLEAGVQGVFLKTEPLDDIIAGIRAVAGGGQALSPRISALLDDAESVRLTAREMQVLQAIARGQTNQAASEALGISPKTIDTHRTNLMRKLGVRSTASLLVRAMRDGLIDLSDID